MIVDAVRSRPAGDTAFYFSTDGRSDDSSMTYGELDVRARRIAGELAGLAEPGDRVLLLFPTGLDYVAALFGILYAGMVAVPAQPPAPARRQPALGRLDGLLRDSGAAAVLCTPAIEALARPEIGDGTAWLTIDDTAPALHEPVHHDPNALALLQYTSGSTGTPRGVMLSHANLAANLEMIRQEFDIGPASRVVSWLALYHDMGLIGCVLGPAVWGVPSVLMPPLRALAHPGNWLTAISRHRATISASPNFGYDAAVRKVPDATRDTLDLSSWSVALNAAEPVRERTMRDFARRFAPCGFRPDAFRPTYGLAEATVFVATRRGVATHGTVVSVGRPAAGTDVRIVGESGRPVPDGEPGEIWVRGPHVGHGYWRQPEATRTVFAARTADGDGPYLRTGDLGFLADGELFVTGRSKDLIIIHGRNYAPEDVEETASRVDAAVRLKSLAAFSVDAEAEEAVLLAELDARPPDDPGILDDVAAAIRVAVSREHELVLERVAFVHSGAIRRTSSGKVRRGACREAYLEGKLGIVAESRIHRPARAELEAYLLRELADLLGVRPAELDASKPLPALGMDSLKAVELRFRVEEELSIALEIESLAVDITVAQLATTLLGQLDGRTTAQVSPAALPVPVSAAPPSLKLSLMFFAGNERGDPGDRYGLLLDAARFADRHGFAAVWTPERHFHPFGGLFPNPSVVGAALAVATSRIRIRAGSVVLPLHDPIRVAEEWSVVDNLSGGRVDVAFAAGRNARDFVLAPDRYAERGATTLDCVRQFRELWRGGATSRPDGLGRMVDVRIHPHPVQPEPGIWLTTAESVETFEAAGTAGAHVLTGLVQQSNEELADRIGRYRAARAGAGHAGAGEVTLMLNTYLGEDDEEVRETVRPPMVEFLRSFVSLWTGQDERRRFATVEPRLQEEMVRLGFERVYSSRALFGPVDRAEEIARGYARAGVTEIACLVDFGLERDQVLAGLERLAVLRERIGS